MTVQIKLKHKYRWKPRSRHPAVGDHNLKRVRRPSHRGETPKYNPREHVLYLKPEGGTVMLHGAEALRLLGDA